jgi:hypothetical protein
MPGTDIEFPCQKLKELPNLSASFEAMVTIPNSNPQFLAMMWTFFAVFCHATLVGALGVFWVIIHHLYVTRYHSTHEGVQRFTIPSYLVLSIYAVGILITILHELAVDYL